MMDGEGGVIVGWQNKLQVAISKLMPESVVAKDPRAPASAGHGKERIASGPS
jgi:hypothetical protein